MNEPTPDRAGGSGRSSAPRGQGSSRPQGAGGTGRARTGQGPKPTGAPKGGSSSSRDTRGTRPPSKDSRGDKPYSKSPRGDRPYDKDTRGDKPYSKSPRGDRPYDKDTRGDKPYGGPSRGPRSAGGRPDASGSRYGRDDRRPGGPDAGRGRRDDRVREAPRPGLAPKANEPETPKGLDLRQLPRGVRAELRGLTAELAEIVGAHLLMAGRLIDTDPELAYAHAEAARRRAARLPITREAAAETAYAAGDFATALTEFRALRRMSGGNEYLPAMADCERALGRYQAALKLVREGLAAEPDAAQQIELRLVEAGVRTDTGQAAEALRLLRNEIEVIGARGTKVARARLRYAYADLLERMGDDEQAERWFDAVVRLDVDGSTDAVDRVAAIRGIVIDFDESEDEFDEEGEFASGEAEQPADAEPAPQGGEAPAE